MGVLVADLALRFDFPNILTISNPTSPRTIRVMRLAQIMRKTLPFPRILSP
jgi:hypothetical protein